MTDAEAAASRVGDCTVYHSPGAKPDLTGLANVTLRPAAALFARPPNRRQVAVLIFDSTLLRHAEDASALLANVIIVAADRASEDALGQRADLSINGLMGPDRLRVMRAACDFSAARATAALCRRELTCTRRDLNQLKQIGIQLMDEHEQDALLERIVSQGKLLTESDAGCLFLLERDDHDIPRLRPAVFRSDSLADLPAPSRAESLPVDNTSIIGHAAMAKEHVVVEDAYALPPDVGYTSNVDFERQFGYHVQSLLAVPMVDRHEHVIGVLAFVNRKSHPRAIVRDKESARQSVVPYTRREVRLGRALASYAAVSIENTTLYARIEHLLESFVKAAVTAIDQRDPSTAGHSMRVATLTTALASAVERSGVGRYRHIHFSRAQMRELYFAALLHDLGKVTVREDVLMKAKKLPPELWERVEGRFDLIRETLEADHYKTCGTSNGTRKTGGGRGNGDGLDAQCSRRLTEIDAFWDKVRNANEPGPLSCSPAELDAIARRSFVGPGNHRMPYLSKEELRYLQIPQGTLNEHERSEIQSHVEQTYQFLLQIPWTDDLKNLAMYARGHHEKLDGSGYPLGLKGEEIPVQTRLMTIADIFDALTAADRPYKKAVPADKALDIIQNEAKEGLLDAELVRVFVQSQVYKQILR